jgi:hypothetical protein
MATDDDALGLLLAENEEDVEDDTSTEAVRAGTSAVVLLVVATAAVSITISAAAWIAVSSAPIWSQLLGWWLMGSPSEYGQP